jgi:replicative DNA helicase
MLRSVAAVVSEWPIYIDDSSTLNVSELVARAKLMIRQYGCQLICVDYLRLVDASVRELRERVGFIADTLRQLAKDTGVPVLALSQLKRPANVNDPPTMIDLKESGDVEAHAHVVLLLYRPLQDGRFTGEDEIIIGKCREGDVGPVPVTYSAQSLIFRPRLTGGTQ